VLEELLEEVVGLMQENAAGKRIELIWQLDPELPRVLSGDAGRLRQVMLNLVGNAIKFTDHGKVVLRALDRKHLSPGMIRFEVEDTGIGIPAPALDTIFDTFTQADNSPTRRFGGTGLGLAIVRQLTHLMGGKVGVTSSPGEGSCFSIEIPLATAESDSATRLLIPESLRGSRIALILDDEELAGDLSRRLRGYGLNSELCASGARSLQLLQQSTDHPVQLAFIDADMSGLGGIRLVEALAGQPHCQDLKIVFLARQEHAVLHSAMSHPRIDQWLYKPIRGEQLELVLQDSLPGLQSSTGAAIETTGEPMAAACHKLLLVEDNRTTQLFVRGILESTDYQLEVAENGAVALQLLDSQRFDLIFMDCQMPVLDGFATTIRLRELGVRIPIVALTARVFADDVVRCQQAGMDDFLKKPFRQQELLDMTAKWLAVRRS
jgi:CheY-like chemotaxis protein